jgi:hypothetical protein
LKAEFRKFIRPSIPQIIDMLKVSNWHVRDAAAGALLKLSEEGMEDVYSSRVFLTRIASRF